MAASYPSSVKTFTAITDGDTVQDEMWEECFDEVVAIENSLLNGFEHNVFPESSGDARTLGTTAKFWGLSYLKGIALTAASELTIATGAVTATQGVHTLDTESDAASDDLDTITAGSGIVTGSLLILRAENVARVVTVKDGTGNLLLGGDFELGATDRQILLLYDGTNWREVGRSSPAVDGTWTPAVSFGGGTTGITYTTQSGVTTRLGRNIFFHGLILLSSNGSSSGDFKITGLPVTNGDNVNRAVTITAVSGFTGLTGALTGFVDNSATSITVKQWSATGNAAVTEAAVTDTALIQVEGWYRA